jgi:hypothetical protein
MSVLELQPSDSNATFLRLLAARSLTHLEPRFKALGWHTAGEFASTCGLNFLQVDDKKFTKRVICILLEKDWDDYKAIWKLRSEPREAMHIRRLFNQCGLLLQHDLRVNEGLPGGQTQAILSDADRNERRKALRAMLAPMNCRGTLQHAVCSEDDVWIMYQRNHVIYLHPKHCPTRDQEVLMEDLSHKSNRPDAPGLAKELGKLADLITDKPRLETPVHVCLLSLDEALMRRGMAFHVIGVMSWPSHEKTRRTLMEALREVTVRSDEVAISYDDLIACDKQIFVMINELCEEGIRPGPQGLPVDLVIDKVLAHRKVDRMLRTRIGKSSYTEREPVAKREPPSDKGANTDKNRAKRQRQAANKKKTNQELASYHQQNIGGGGGRGKGDGGGKGAGRRRGKGNQDNAWSPPTPPPPPNGKGGKQGKGKDGKQGKGKT